MIRKEWSSLLLYGKLLFYSLLLFSCRQKKDISKTDITILWDNGRARGIAIPLMLIDGGLDNSYNEKLSVKLAGHGIQPDIAGERPVENGNLIFKPLIPFTRGLHYDVFLKQKLLAEIEIPRDTAVPKLISIYPTQDTVPENLLKIYLVFSSPMVQGHSLQYIKLTSEKGDSLPGSFLYLQQELWNEEGTELTVWFDPGRIKRDLIPNKLLGPPLVAGKNYKLIISGDWRNTNETSLGNSSAKKFIAASRDSISPLVDHWKIRVPEKNTNHPLQINFGEPLDYALLKHAIKVVDSSGKTMKGTISITGDQRGYFFTPEKIWSPGNYKILVEGRLEDLAGNNLNRLFDEDLMLHGKHISTKENYERAWRIN